MLCSNKQPEHKTREASSHKEMPQQSKRVAVWQNRTRVGRDARADTKAKDSLQTAPKQPMGAEVSGHGDVVGMLGLKY